MEGRLCREAGLFYHLKSFKMELYETSNTFIKWIESCTKQQQLDLLNEIIDPFVCIRFMGNPDLSHQVGRILVALQEQSKIVCKEPFPILNMN